MLDVGDMVKHKKIKHLMRGKVISISQSGKKAEVRWSKSGNPELIWDHKAYYRIESLQVIGITISLEGYKINEQVEIPCLGCGGDGWIVTHSYSGYPEQEICEDCEGTGKGLVDKEHAHHFLGGTRDE